MHGTVFFLYQNSSYVVLDHVLVIVDGLLQPRLDKKGEQVGLVGHAQEAGHGYPGVIVNISYCFTFILCQKKLKLNFVPSEQQPPFGLRGRRQAKELVGDALVNEDAYGHLGCAEEGPREDLV